MNRRDFIRRTAGGTAIAWPMATAGNAETSPTPTQNGTADAVDLRETPIFCAHEHWGSINAMGMAEEGFRADTEAGALPSRTTSVWDVVLDPYFGGFLHTAGADPQALAQQAGAKDFLAWWQRAPETVLQALRPHLEAQALTGAFQCIRRGIHCLHGADIATFDLAQWQKADAAVANAYTDMHAWYARAMKQAHFSELIRPVHPEFYARTASEAAARLERSFTHTILRIDPLLHLEAEHCPRRNGLAKLGGVDPHDAASWRAFIARICDLAAAQGVTGIKQLQAYSRPLNFEQHPETAIKWRGALTQGELIVLQDWIVNECCKQAHERGWAHQIHVGTHNLGQSSPVPLEAMAKRYPRMNLVLLHCWPFISESGWLAKQYPNVHIDACWQLVLNPAFFRRSLAEWLGYVPARKLMCSQDATSVEMAVGSSLFVREILGEGLRAHGAGLVDTAALMGLARDILHNNAVRVYKVGTETG